MQDHRLDPQGPRNRACVLPTRAAETREDMFGRGKTARLRQGANGTAHDFVGDAYKALGDFVDAHRAACLGVDMGR